ncbi:MAG: hypothetical protein LBF97_03580 [Elusimicrobiota bacterium]|jgi:hypothetical protein|nr:hypothetical protein [Elusimicrobiota bacterium]
MKISINVKTVLCIIILFLILFSISGVFYLKKYETRLINNLIEKAKLIVRMSDISILEDITKYNDISLLSFLEKIESIGDVLNVVIFSNNGTVLANTDVYEMGLQYTDKITNWVINLQNFAYMHSVEANKNVIIFASPLVDKELGIIAFIKFSLSKSSYLELLKKEKKYYFMGIFIFSSLFIILFFLYFYTQISHPLILIKDGSKLLINNLVNFKFNIKSKDEIEDIYNNLNNLVNEFVKMLESKDLEKDVIIKSEEIRIESFFKDAYKDSNILLADSNNKIIYEQTVINGIFKEKTIGMHLLDAINNADLISFLTDAYSKKENILNQEILINEYNYKFSIVFIKKQNILSDKTIFIFNK